MKFLHNLNDFDISDDEYDALPELECVFHMIHREYECPDVIGGGDYPNDPDIIITNVVFLDGKPIGKLRISKELIDDNGVQLPNGILLHGGDKSEMI